MAGSNLQGQLVIGIDTGGTFTDLVLRVPPASPGQAARLITHKLLSTPDDPGRAIIQGVRELLAKLGSDTPTAFTVIHGSTVATNALLERRGAETVFITTQGFEDLLAIGRQNRRALYDLQPATSTPLIASERCLGAAERVGANGAVLKPLTGEEIERLVQAVVDQRVESVAICLLNSFVNPQHEARLAEALARRGIFVSVSHQVLPEHREYERASTTVVNAYVSPLMDRYLRSLSRSLEPFGARQLLVMQSNGGCAPPEEAGAYGVHTVLSGPAGGVVGALAAAKRSGVQDIITFDMGGTSTDVALARGVPELTTEGAIDGLPVRIPMLAIHTVGAGGGSIAYLDAGGALRVGPESAGAYPGPACYGRGGDKPTVTDAHLVLGRLPHDAFLGGRMRLDVAAARRAVGSLAARLGASVDHTAWAILQVANTQMERAIRVISVEKGHDPAEFTLVSFGGAGGLHAVGLARSMGIRRVLIPPHPGLLSAWGMCVSDVVRTYSQGMIGLLEELLPTGLAALERLMQRACRELRDHAHVDGKVYMQPALDLRYAGQSFELTVPLTPLTWTIGNVEVPRPAHVTASELMERFHQAHEERYGYRFDTAVELVAVRLQARCLGPGVEVQTGASAVLRHGRTPKPLERRWVFMEGRWEAAPHYRRAALPPGTYLPGSAVITEAHSTVIVGPQDAVRVDGHGTLFIDVG